MSEENKNEAKQQLGQQQKQQNAIQEAAAQLQKDNSPVSQLLSVIIMREAREAAKEEKAEQARIARDAKRSENSKHTAKATLDSQVRCKHLKGGRRGPKAGVKDFAVSLHTFIDQKSVIKCHLCSMKWKPADTADYLVRNGKNIRNHTRLGWAEAVAMAQQSTNTATSSEIPMDATPRALQAGVTDTEELAEYEF